MTTGINGATARNGRYGKRPVSIKCDSTMKNPAITRYERRSRLPDIMSTRSKKKKVSSKNPVMSATGAKYRSYQWISSSVLFGKYFLTISGFIVRWILADPGTLVHQTREGI